MIINIHDVKDGKVVSVHYTLKNKAGEVIDTSSGGHPLTYIQGSGSLVPGFEQAMAGKRVGDAFGFEVSPEEGYGVRDEEAVQVVPRSAFPAEMEIDVGMQFGVQGEGGHVMPVWVLGVEEENIVLDLNHPLAGETLHFSVEIVDIRDATREELAHGHVHGPGGHAH